MFQNFTASTSPETGAPRLAALRDVLVAEGLDGFLIPRADAHQGENVAPRDERLAWLTGFTGSAGFCAALRSDAGVFIDGRYTLQVRDEVDLSVYTPVSLYDVPLSDWLIEKLPEGGEIAYDPWLHGFDQIEKLTSELLAHGITLRKIDNLVDRIWVAQPDAPKGMIIPHPIEFAGEESAGKRTRIGALIEGQGLDAFVLTMPESICWLLNIRGADIERTPVALCFAVVHADGRVDLYVDPDKCDFGVVKHLGDGVALHADDQFADGLKSLTGKVGVDRVSAPVAVSDLLQHPVWGTDPCILPKACKNAVEIEGSRAAHLRDGAAMANFLCWLDQEAPKGGLTEIKVAQQLEGFRANTNSLRDVSFDTISGAGPNGAIVHYRVTDKTDRSVTPGDILLVDSGGQYQDGTTDITRTVATGAVDPEAAKHFTLVLKGMIAITQLRFPHGIAGAHIDSFARSALWQAGLDYDHGTGHGVGSYLGVHEGPAGIARRYDVPYATGMILSNEPGYYKEGAYGIRIENLIVVTEPEIPEGGDRPMHGFETLTFTPIDRRLVRVDLLTPHERDWLNVYHAEVLEKIGPLVGDDTRAWLTQACAPV